MRVRKLFVGARNKVSDPGHRCPRRDENPGADERFPGPDHYRSGHGMVNSFAPGCTYCGSISGDDFMAFVKAGGHVGGSDKNYKVYLDKDTGVPGRTVEKVVKTKQGGSHTSISMVPGTGVQHAKFYWMHLSEEQMREFIRLFKEDKVNHSLYVRPYFFRYASDPE